MANDLVVSVMIGAALQSSFAAAFAGARGTLTALGNTSDLLKRKHVEMGQAMERSLRHLSGASLAAIHRDYERLGRTIDDLRVKQERLAARMARGVELKNSRQEHLSNLRESAATGLAVGLPVIASIKHASKFESGLRDIAITGNIRGAEEVALGAAIRKAALSTNQGHLAIMQGVGTLVAAGMDTSRAGEYAGLLGKAATATNAQMDDLAKMVYLFTETLGIKSQEGVKEAFNRAAFGGKLGRFELKDMAGALPELAQAFAARGIKGQQAVTEIIASLEVGREGAGTGAEAVTNMRNWLAHMNSKHTADNFQKVGVDYQKSLQQLIAGGYSNYEASLMTASAFIDSKGEAFAKEWKKAGKSGDEEAQRKLMESFGLNEVFQDIQTINHLLAMRQNWDKYQSNKREMGSAKAMGTIDEDYQRRVQTMQKAWERFTDQVTDVAITIGSTLLPTLVETLDVLAPTVRAFGQWADAHPGLLRGIIGLAAGVAALRMSVFAMKFLGNFMFLAPANAVGTAWAVLASRVAIVRAMFSAGASRLPLLLQFFGLGALRAGQFAAKLSALGGWVARTAVLLVGYFRSLGAGALALGKALGGALLGGLRLVVQGALVLGRVLVGPLVAGLRLAGQAVLWLGRAMLMNPIGLAVTAVGVAAYMVWKHWGTIKAAFMSAWGWLKGVKSQFFAAGSELINGLVEGVSAKLASARDTVVALGSSIKGWFKSALGINSPSRVFMGYGDNIVEGAVIGIQRSMPLAGRAAAAMANTTQAVGMAAAKPMQSRLQQSVQATIGSSGAEGKTVQPAGKMVVHYNPNITLQGSDNGSVGSQLEKATQLSFHEFEAMMRRYEMNRRRLAN